MVKRIIKKVKMNIFFSTISVAVIAGLMLLGIAVWNEYKMQLLQNQEKQLLLISKSLSRYMSVSIERYENDIRYLSKLEIKGDLSAEHAKKYIDSRNDFISDIIWYKGKNEISKTVYNTKVQQKQLLSVVDNTIEIYQFSGNKDIQYLGFKYSLESGDSICLLVDSEKYYEQLISDIQIGTNGYVMIKNSDGTIIMHPKNEQWGINVIEGRKELYPNLNYGSLEALLKQQQSGKEGISEYYSYWWTDPNLPRVKKVSAYSPVTVGKDFWIVSAVTDFDDLYLPIANGFIRILLVFVTILIISGLLLFVMAKLLLEKKKNASEINYLKELNSVLEEMHRGEEEIRHQQRLQIMGTMTGGIVHEFNNFLTPILGYAELLKVMLPKDSEEYDGANEIFEAAEKAKDVIHQISSLSKKNLETVYKTICIKKLLQRFFKMAQSVCPSNIHTECNIEVEQECIMGNTTQINQVLLNVFVNAVHAIDGQRGKIEIICRCVLREELEIKKKIPSTWEKFICIEMRDDGCGMDIDTLEHIFEPFFTTKRGGKGTGLGLYLTEQIIMSHRGVIYAESRLNIGTTFHIILPLVENKMQLVSEEVAAEKNKIFVIADDNRKVLNLLETSLNKLNITAYTCKTKEEVQSYIEKYEADALFIDESIDNIGGIELCMMLRNKYPHLLTFIMCSRITREIVEAKRNGLIDGYVEKPVSDIELIDAVRLERQRKTGL